MHGVGIVFDLTDRRSLDTVSLYYDKVNAWNPEAFVFLMGNKCDLQYDRMIKHEDDLSTASNLGLDYFEVSATDNTTLTCPFNKICAT